MVEIHESDAEWAAIYRMGKMLRTPHESFQTTSTYSNFAAIMCWTVQRIRTRPIYPGADFENRQPPAGDLNFEIFDSIQIDMNDKDIETFFGQLPVASDDLNRLQLEDRVGVRISALSFAIALRNAVAHGDGRNVTPVNRPGELVGFKFSLRSPSRFPEWNANTQLNRSAMAQIAGKMADVFCERFRANVPSNETSVQAMTES